MNILTSVKEAATRTCGTSESMAPQCPKRGSKLRHDRRHQRERCGGGREAPGAERAMADPLVCGCRRHRPGSVFRHGTLAPIRVCDSRRSSANKCGSAPTWRNWMTSPRSRWSSVAMIWSSDSAGSICRRWSSPTGAEGSRLSPVGRRGHSDAHRWEPHRLQPHRGGHPRGL